MYTSGNLNEQAIGGSPVWTLLKGSRKPSTRETVSERLQCFQETHLSESSV